MRTREDLLVRMLKGKVLKKTIFTMTLENVYWEDDSLMVDANLLKVDVVLTSENSHQPFSTTDLFIWLGGIIESYVEKIYTNSKGPSVSYLPSVKYKNGELYLKTGSILVSGELEKKLIVSIENLYRDYSPTGQFIDCIGVYLGVAGGDSVLCALTMKSADEAWDFSKVFLESPQADWSLNAEKKLTDQINKVLDLCEQNSPVETVFELEDIKVYPW